MSDSGSATQEVLRADILAMGQDDFVSMADVQASIFDGRLADLSAEHQRLIVNTVGSLLRDGLVEVGVIPGPNDTGFKPWPGTPDEVMAQFVDRFNGYHEDRRRWQYAIWLNLTAAGQRASAEISAKETDDG